MSIIKISTQTITDKDNFNMSASDHHNNHNMDKIFNTDEFEYLCGNKIFYQRKSARNI